jgi:hypothetical protein
MSHRHNAYVSITEPAYGGVSPNAYVPQITVEVRAFWPPSHDHEKRVVDLIHKAAIEAMEKVLEDTLDTMIKDRLGKDHD